jgi:hypothetical protein
MLRHDRRSAARRSELGDTTRADRVARSTEPQARACETRKPREQRHIARQKRTARRAAAAMAAPEIPLSRRFLGFTTLPRGGAGVLVRRCVCRIFAEESFMVRRERGLGRQRSLPDRGRRRRKEREK